MGVRIGGQRQELTAVASLGLRNSHTQHPPIPQAKRVGNRLDNRLSRAPRFAATTDDCIGQRHRIKTIFPIRHRLGKRIVFAIRGIDRSAPCQKLALEEIVRCANFGIKMRLDQAHGRIGRENEKADDREPEPPILSPHRHDVNDGSCDDRPHGRVYVQRRRRFPEWPHCAPWPWQGKSDRDGEIRSPSGQSDLRAAFSSPGRDGEAHPQSSLASSILPSASTRAATRRRVSQYHVPLHPSGSEVAYSCVRRECKE